ncbi:MAG: hypothetical protein ACLFNQ_12745 [Spirochaetaceae bacterium]
MPDHLQHEDALAMLHELADTGLLVPLEFAPVEATGSDQGPVTRLIIPTRDRTALVTRLADLVATAAPTTPPAIFIVDDSDSPSGPTPSSNTNPSANASTATNMTESVVPHHIRLDDRLSPDGPFAAVHRSSVPPEAIRFALLGDRRCPPSLGAMRNTNYLLGAGQRVVTMDDDTVALGFRTALPGAPIHYTGSRDEPVFEFYRDRETLLSQHELAPLDPIALTVEWLGRRVPGPDSDLSEVTPELFHQLTHHKPTIDVVCHGTIGDGGIGVRQFVLQATGEQRERFMATEDRYRVSTTSREMTRFATSPTVLAHPYLMSTVMGLDCTVLLPPSYPYGRGDEGLFAAMIHHLFNDSLILQAPTAFLHSPPDDATHRAAPWFTELPLRVCWLLQIILNTYPKPPGGTRADRLICFGEWLRAHSARLSEGEFADWIESTVFHTRAGYYRSLEELLDRYEGSPEYWAEDVLKLQANVRAQLAGGHLGPVEEFKPLSLSREDEYCLLKTHFASYAEVLMSWPEICRVMQA